MAPSGGPEAGGFTALTCTPASRILIGKGAEKAATVRLNDPHGHTRILLSVDSLGAPSMQFLDSAGKVTYELPAHEH